MEPTNPYKPPQTETIRRRQPKRPRVKQQVGVMGVVLSATVGAAIGVVAVAPFVRGSGDPTGASIAAGLGGVAGFGGIALWMALTKATPNQIREDD